MQLLLNNRAYPLPLPHHRQGKRAYCEAGSCFTKLLLTCQQVPVFLSLAM